MNDNLTDAQKAQRLKALAHLEDTYRQELVIYVLIGLVGLVIPTGLIFLRSKKKKSENEP